MFYFTIGTTAFEWNWSRTVNVFIGGRNVDCFTLGYQDEPHTPAEVMAAAYDWNMAH